MTAAAALAGRIDALLPQTQCRQCGYAGCQPYADAIACGETDINRCPPGGVSGVRKLATLLGRAPLALDPACGVEKPRALAVIDEAVCIGCTKCIQACPVDAIVGAAKRMHTVLADECTGCELCLAPCPVDCIEMIALPPALDEAQECMRADVARERFRARNRRLQNQRAERAARGSPQKTSAPTGPISRDAVLQAIARGKARKQTLARSRAHLPTA